MRPTPPARFRSIAVLLAMGLASPLSVQAQAQAPAAPPAAAAAAAPKTMPELLAVSAPSDWRTPDPDDLLVMQLPAGRVVIELAPQFAPEHVANIRALARAAFWDGLSVYRVQDGFVSQWGDPAGEDEPRRPLAPAKDRLPAEVERDATGLAFHRLPDADGWAPEVGFVDGFPAARDPAAGRAWLAHCYGMVGAGRDLALDSSTGAELYVVIGQSPRQLDRNITTVGRVLEGMEWLSSLPRGGGAMGMHAGGAGRTPIRSVRIAADLPPAERPALEVLRTDTPLFDAVVEARRNRTDAFYKRPAGHIDLCYAPLPVRAAAR